MIVSIVAGLFACESKAPSEPVTPSQGEPAQPAPSKGQGFAIEEPAAPAPSADQQPVAPEGHPAPAGKLRADSPCAAICVRSTELGCLQAPVCEALCTSSMQQGTCVAEMQRATDCMLREPAKNWECTPTGLAAIRSGFCEAEQHKMVICVRDQKATDQIKAQFRDENH